MRGEARGFGVVLAGPVGGPGGRIADGGAMSTRGLDTASVPASLEEHFDQPAGTAWTYTDDRHRERRRRRRDRAGDRGRLAGALPADSQTYTLYYLFPLTEEQETLGLVVAGAAHRRRAAAGAGRRADLAGDPPGGHPDPAGPAGGRAARRRAAPGAAAGLRRGRPGPPGHLVQPDGHQPAAPDPPARGAEPGAAPVRLRRLPRAAHAAHHGPDGRRRAARRPRATSTRPPPAPPSCSRPSSTGSRRCSSTCSRSAASTPAPRSSTPTTSTSSTSRTGSST